MNLPANFFNDIQGKDTSLIPLVVFTDLDIFISTNNLSVDGQYFQPILLNIPSIKQSVDIENRRFKISSVTLSISNYEYEGSRFSDLLQNTSMINNEVCVYWKSQTSTTLDTGEDTDCPKVYAGKVRRISHTTDTVTVELEDLTEEKHKELPQTLLPSDSSVNDKYKNKPIPMVYGHVDRSPVVLVNGNSELQTDDKDISEYVVEEIGWDSQHANENYDPLWIGIDNGYINVRRVSNRLPSDGATQYFTENNLIIFAPNCKTIWGTDLWNYDENGIKTTTKAEMGYNILACRDNTNNYQIKLKNDRRYLNSSDEHATTEDFFGINMTMDKFNAINDGSSDENNIELQSIVNFESNEEIGFGDNGIKGLELLLMTMNISYLPSYDVMPDETPWIMGFRMNGLGITNHNNFIYPLNNGLNLRTDYGYAILSRNFGNFFYHYDAIGGTSNFYVDFTNINDNNNAYIPTFQRNVEREMFNFLDQETQNPDSQLNIEVTYDNLTGNDPYINGDPDAPPSNVIVFYCTDNGEINIDFRTIVHLEANNSVASFDSILNVSGNLNEIEVLRESRVIKIFEKDFYVNVKGREYQGELAQNPAVIIRHILEEELGYTDFDEVDYQEAVDVHDGMKYGFTVYDKQISSKKLIEDIAKSTLMFPHFGNDGKFRFNSLKESYTQDDFINAEAIPVAEVIDYTFSRTKPEQIYSKYEVDYYYDYAQKSYLKKVSDDFSITETSHLDFYGFEDSDSNIGKLESAYIRDEETAKKLNSLLFNYYKNQHLTLKLKLPVKYIGLSVGDIVKFNELLGGITAYGIDYTLQSFPNGQQVYPLFYVTSLHKNIDTVSVELIQLHNITSEMTGDFSYIDADVPDRVFTSTNNEHQFKFTFNDEQFVIGQGLNDSNLLQLFGINNWSMVFEDGSTTLLSSFDDLLPDEVSLTIADTYNLLEVWVLNENQEEYIGSLVKTFAGIDFFIDIFPLTLDNDSVIKLVIPQIDAGITFAYNPPSSIVSSVQEAVYIPPEPVVGDINGDGVADILDIVGMVSFVINQTGLTQDEQELADINGDGVVNILDVVQLVDQILGSE